MQLYKQLGNSISVGAVWYVFKQAVNAYSEILNKTCPQLVEKVRTAATNPDDVKPLVALHIDEVNRVPIEASDADFRWAAKSLGVNPH